MATKDEVNGFLAQFHTKAKVFGITYFGGREKNMNTRLRCKGKDIILHTQIAGYYFSLQNDLYAAFFMPLS